jgi:hypothetical protein
MCRRQNVMCNLPLKHALLLLLVFTVDLSSQPVSTTYVLAQMHKRLTSVERRTYHNPIVFTGEVRYLGPVYQQACKQGVEQKVDFTVDRMLLGNHPGSIVRTGYINCTWRPLPSPPFTLHAKVIVYCEQRRHGVNCLAPVELADYNLTQIASWIASQPKNPR